MSIYQIIAKPIAELREYLTKYGAELRSTKFPDTYLIKFSPHTQSTDPAINRLRGVIFNAKTLKVYSLGYPVPMEFKDQDKACQDSTLQTIKGQPYLVQEALDGTLIRLWFHEESGKWMLSTNSKEDANDAYWMNDLSFGELFESTLQTILNGLNPDHVYLFSLCHPLNVIVVNHVQPHIYHVTTYDRVSLEEVVDDLGLERPPIHQISVDEVLERVKSSKGTPVASAGYVIVQSIEGEDETVVHRYRFENANYTSARVLRGDSNKIESILLTHMMNSPEQLEEFLLYYPIYVPTYNLLIERYNALAWMLYQTYSQRYQQHRYILVHPRHHRFLLEMHTELYMTHLKPRGATVQAQDVLNYLYNQSPETVLSLLDA
jgi:hypothetical protein